MSRCFPFPPPGYEKKFKAENLDFIAKEKRKEKKHKKEKKEKEKKEHKEKKEKDPNKDKHKERRGKKEKHKDRKKYKDIGKGNRTPEDGRIENRTGGHSEFHAHETSQKAEAKDSKFAEELGRRTRDDGAANQLVGGITSSVHRKPGGASGATCPSLEIKRAVDRTFPAHIGSGQRYSGLPVENVAGSLQRNSGNIGAATSIAMDRTKTFGKVTIGISAESDRNHGISYLANRKALCSTPGIEKEKSGEKNVFPIFIESRLERARIGERIVAPSSVSTQKRNNADGFPVENLSFCCKTEVMVNSSPWFEKERVKGREMFPHPFSSEQGTRTSSLGQPEVMDRRQKLDGNGIKKDEDRKGFKDGDHGEKRSRPKDADRHGYEKEEEEKIVKPEKIEIDKMRNFWKKDQADTLNSKPLAPHKDTTGGIRDVDPSMKKRKDVKANGILHGPSKVPRLSPSSSQPPANDWALEPTHGGAPFGLPSKEAATNKSKLDNHSRRINGTPAIEPRPPASKNLLENGGGSLNLPHPDSAHLHQIYDVPKTESWPEFEDLGWLFERRVSLPKRGADENAPQVWAEALRIGSDDVFALPYVVPF